MEPPIHTLFVTLKRSFAGTRDSQRRILESLGLRWRQHTVERANTASLRGALDKVRRPASWALACRHVPQHSPPSQLPHGPPSSALRRSSTW